MYLFIVGAHTCVYRQHRVPVEIRGQLINFLLPQCGHRIELRWSGAVARAFSH